MILLPAFICFLKRNPLSKPASENDASSDQCPCQGWESTCAYLFRWSRYRSSYCDPPARSSRCPFSETVIGEGLNSINGYQHRAADGKNPIQAKRIKLGISEWLLTAELGTSCGMERAGLSTNTVSRRINKRPAHGTF
jgi:hypothetical protein